MSLAVIVTVTAAAALFAMSVLVPQGKTHAVRTQRTRRSRRGRI